MKILFDKGQKAGKHELEHEMLRNKGVEIEGYPLPIGDYILCDDKVLEVITRKQKRGVDVKKMDFIGSYTRSVDTKYGLPEIVTNVCSKDHGRLHDEICLAENNNVDLYFVIPDDGGWCDYRKTIWNKPIRTIDDLFQWKNPRAFIFKKGKQLFPNCTKGSTLAKSLITIQARYPHIKFVFCGKQEVAQKIVELLIGDSK